MPPWAAAAAARDLAAGQDICQDIVIEEGFVSVYSDTTTHPEPPVGKKLNTRATVVLHNVSSSGSWGSLPEVSWLHSINGPVEHPRILSARQD